MIEFTALPDASWLRAFHAQRAFTAEELEHVHEKLDDFVAVWTSHEQDVQGSFETRDALFILVAADESEVPLSGCSKDSVVGVVRQLEQDLGVAILEAPPICFRHNGDIVVTGRPEFQQLAERGDVDADTIVFDETIETVGAVRSGRFELPAGDAWHGEAWDLRSAVSGGDGV